MIRWFLTFLCLLAASLPVWAKPLAEAGLYQEEVLVNSRSAVDRTQAVNSAFAHVLTKVSGNKTVILMPQIQTALPSALDLVQEYRYESKTGDEGKAPLLVLHLYFDPSAVDKLLADAGQAIWQGKRPKIVLWMDHQGEPLKQDLAELARQIKAYAATRGMTVLTPLMDLQDIQHVNPAVIAAFDQRQLMNAGHRYGGEAVLTLSLQAEKETVKSQWHYAWQREQHQWQVDTNNLQQLVSEGIDQLADELASRNSIIAENTSEQPLELVVSNIVSFADYNKVLTYLQGLAIVNKVDVAEVQNNQVIYQLKVAGELGQLVTQLQDSHWLIPLDSDDAIDTGQLHYRLGISANS